MTILKLLIIIPFFCLLAAEESKVFRWDINHQYKTKMRKFEFLKESMFHDAEILIDELYEQFFKITGQRLREIKKELTTSDNLDIQMWIHTINTVVSNLSTFSWYKNPRLFDNDTVTPFDLLDHFKFLEEDVFNVHYDQALKCFDREDDECTKLCLDVLELTVELMGKMLLRYKTENYSRFLTILKFEHDKVKTKIILRLGTLMRRSRASPFEPNLEEILTSLNVPLAKLPRPLLTANQTKNLGIITHKTKKLKYAAYKLTQDTRNKFMSTINGTMSIFQTDLRKLFQASSPEGQYGINVDESINRECGKLESRQIADCITSIEDQLNAHEKITDSIGSRITKIIETLQNVPLTEAEFQKKYNKTFYEIKDLTTQLDDWLIPEVVEEKMNAAILCCKKQASNSKERIRLSLMDDDALYSREEL